MRPYAWDEVGTRFCSPVAFQKTTTNNYDWVKSIIEDQLFRSLKSEFDSVNPVKNSYKKTKEYAKMRAFFRPTKIIVNDDAFIVFWPDKTKTILHLMPGDNNDVYAAFGQALMKKVFDTTSMAHRIVDNAICVSTKKPKKKIKKAKSENKTSEADPELIESLNGNGCYTGE